MKRNYLSIHLLILIGLVPESCGHTLEISHSNSVPLVRRSRLLRGFSRQTINLDTEIIDLINQAERRELHSSSSKKSKSWTSTTTKSTKKSAKAHKESKSSKSKKSNKKKSNKKKGKKSRSKTESNESSESKSLSISDEDEVTNGAETSDLQNESGTANTGGDSAGNAPTETEDSNIEQENLQNENLVDATGSKANDASNGGDQHQGDDEQSGSNNMTGEDQNNPEKPLGNNDEKSNPQNPDPTIAYDNTPDDNPVDPAGNDVDTEKRDDDRGQGSDEQSGSENKAGEDKDNSVNPVENNGDNAEDPGQSSPENNSPENNPVGTTGRDVNPENPSDNRGQGDDKQSGGENMNGEDQNDSESPLENSNEGDHSQNQDQSPPENINLEHNPVDSARGDGDDDAEDQDGEGGNSQNQDQSPSENINPENNPVDREGDVDAEDQDDNNPDDATGGNTDAEEQNQQGGEDIMARVDIDEPRLVRIAHSRDPEKCMAYDHNDEFPLEVIDCSSSGTLDLWEIIPVSSNGRLFKLRHDASNLCIPENPEHPDDSFNCFHHGSGHATADQINGLVDCDSPFAAEIGSLGHDRAMTLSNNKCVMGGNQVHLMSYSTEDKIIILWGETILFTLQESVQEFDLVGLWHIKDA